MGVPTAFDEENVLLDKPDEMSRDECVPLSARVIVYSDGMTGFITCWKISLEELEEIKRTGRIWITILGSGLPPHRIDGVKPDVLSAP